MNTRIKLNEYGDIEYCYIWLAIGCENHKEILHRKLYNTILY